MNTPDPTQVQPVQRTAFDAAATLDKGQFRRYLQALEAQSAVQRGDPPPSALGRLFKPAETERKLVLFTLAGIVMLTIIAVFAIEMWGDDNSTITTTLVTIAGTGLGFIGGMVSEGKRTPNREDQATSVSTTHTERTTTELSTEGGGVPGRTDESVATDVVDGTLPPSDVPSDTQAS